VCTLPLPGVRVASESEIKLAYKQKAKELHPDKHADEPPEQQKETEEAFKLLGEGFEVLTDPLKRPLYGEPTSPFLPVRVLHRHAEGVAA